MSNSEYIESLARACDQSYARYVANDISIATVAAALREYAADRRRQELLRLAQAEQEIGHYSRGDETRTCESCRYFTPRQRPHVTLPEGVCCHVAGPMDFDGNNAIVSPAFGCTLHQRKET